MYKTKVKSLKLKNLESTIEKLARKNKMIGSSEERRVLKVGYLRFCILCHKEKKRKENMKTQKLICHSLS